MNCVICGTRKPRRRCPGVGGDICTICCGTGREETIDCPHTCEYLLDAHLHETIEPVDPDTIPNSGIDVPEEFVTSHVWLLELIGEAIADVAEEMAKITDHDVRQAFESLVQTYRTLQSGLYYEQRPANLYAGAVAEAVTACVAELREEAVEAGESPDLDDATILKIILFLQRLEYVHNNGRRLSRAFLDIVRRLSAEARGEDLDDTPEPLIVL